MGTMTIGAKYKTTVKDPGTTGILRMVRSVLPRCIHPRRLLPSETPLHHLLGARIRWVRLCAGVAFAARPPPSGLWIEGEGLPN